MLNIPILVPGNSETCNRKNCTFWDVLKVLKVHWTMKKKFLSKQKLIIMFVFRALRIYDLSVNIRYFLIYWAKINHFIFEKWYISYQMRKDTTFRTQIDGGQKIFFTVQWTFRTVSTSFWVTEVLCSYM